MLRSRLERRDLKKSAHVASSTKLSTSPRKKKRKTIKGEDWGLATRHLRLLDPVPVAPYKYLAGTRAGPSPPGSVLRPLPDLTVG